MAILGSIHSQVAGMNRAAQKVGDVAERVGRGEPLKAKDPVDLIAAERSFQANVKAIQAEDRMIGALLDIKT